MPYLVHLHAQVNIEGPDYPWVRSRWQVQDHPVLEYRMEAGHVPRHDTAGASYVRLHYIHEFIKVRINGLGAYESFAITSKILCARW
jgi:hypothetical protein